MVVLKEMIVEEREMEFHYPVMYREVLDGLQVSTRRVVVDCTMGVGSHALEFFKVMPQDGFLIGIDKDEESLQIASQRLEAYKDRVRLVKEDFRNLDRVLKDLGMKRVPAFFFDLGISSYQLADGNRGFSFLHDGPLDMRMDRSSFVSAYDLVNYLSENELALIFKKFGEEKFSRRIAHKLVEKRKSYPIMSTSQLSDLILEAIPRKYLRYRIHPATRVFQALRIAVNRELDALSAGLKKAIEHLSPGGRIAVISFHSLEDRIVKYTFREYVQQGALTLVYKKPLRPSPEELVENISSRSAKLRVAERV